MDVLDDLLLRVRRRGTAGPEAQQYVAELWAEGGRRFEPEPLLLGDYQEPQTTDPRAIAAHGLDLFNRLFVGRLAVAFQQAWAAAAARDRRIRLRLALDAQAPLLHAIPWELMHFDDSGGISPPRPLAAESRVAFSRYIELADYAEGQPVAHRPVRMLTAMPAPNDLRRWKLAELDRAAEERDLGTRFSPLVSSGQFTQDLLPRGSAEALQAALADGSLAGPRERGYDVLLYYGHALHHPSEGSRLVLEDPQSGGVRLYDGAELVAFLQKLPASHRPALAALVACNSAASGAGLNSLAARLVIDAGIPAVLAMQRLIEITVARSFTYHLSEQLLRDGVVDLAVNGARRRIFQPGSLSWSTPVLYMRNASGRLFTPNPQLDYVEQILRDPAILRWGGAEFIDLGVLAIAPGQDWSLLRYRPEDAPAVVGILEVMRRTLQLEPARERGRPARAAPERPLNLTALIGPPHSGQTTVLQRLCYELAEAVTRDVTRPPGLLLSLAGYDQQRGNARLERHLTEAARAVSPALGDSLAQLFRPSADGERPRFVFLLDSLDALPPAARAECARELAALARRHPEQQFVIASTQDSYPGHLLADAQVLVLQPLTEQQLISYLRQRSPKLARQLLQQIRDNRLVALATDPSLLTMIYDRLAPDPLARVTRNQLVQEYLDRRLGDLSPRYSMGDAARESLVALGWHSRWNHQEQIPLADLFSTLGAVRRERDYSLEDLYSLLCEARLLVGVGQHTVRFVNPMVNAYCAAAALAARPDSAARLDDLITLCSSPERLPWWEDVIYFFAGMVANPLPLFAGLAAAIRGGSYTHALIAARCLEAVPPEQEDRVPAALRAELLDACTLRLRADREPSAERREQIATALGRLSYLQVRHELRRILVERVRQTSGGPRYEYTNVRIAAARALRNIYSVSPIPSRQEWRQEPAGDLLLTSYDDEAGAGARAVAGPLRMPSMAEIRDDQMLVRLMRIWQQEGHGRAEFLGLLRSSPNPPERALAAFAIGDLRGESPARRLSDARQLLRVIVSPGDRGDQELSDDWEDTMWAAADALTLFEPDQVIPLLNIVARRRRPLSDSAAQQLAYVAGRLRATSPEMISWLIRTLITNPSQSVKARALQSLAWMGGAAPQEQLRLADGRPGPTLKELVQAIAAWRPIRPLEIGAFAFSPRKTDLDGTPLYLRRKAIEALAWIGDADTLKDLGAVFLDWPLELREHWYQAAATIGRRLGNGRR